MAYTLVIGQKNYSSWSMRAWLLLHMVGVEFDEVTIPLYLADSHAAVRARGGETGMVPVLIDDGFPVWDTLAIFETVYEAFPKVWPGDARDRARARSFSGEVHSAFGALRSAMPLNIRARTTMAKLSAEVAADIARTKDIWTTHCANTWLFGEFGGADIMFAPVATRFRTYGVELDGPAREYMDRLLQHPLVVEWTTLAEAETTVIPRFELAP
jgi:glutathione S-transferase